MLVETCTEAEYIKLVEALCATHTIPLIKVGDAKVLGKWAGLCKIDRDGNARKIESSLRCVSNSVLCAFLWRLRDDHKTPSTEIFFEDNRLSGIITCSDSFLSPRKVLT